MPLRIDGCFTDGLTGVPEALMADTDQSLRFVLAL